MLHAPQKVLQAHKTKGQCRRLVMSCVLLSCCSQPQHARPALKGGSGALCSEFWLINERLTTQVLSPGPPTADQAKAHTHPPHLRHTLQASP